MKAPPGFGEGLLVVWWEVRWQRGAVGQLRSATKMDGGDRSELQGFRGVGRRSVPGTIGLETWLVGRCGPEGGPKSEVARGSRQAGAARQFSPRVLTNGHRPAAGPLGPAGGVS